MCRYLASKSALRTTTATTTTTASRRRKGDDFNIDPDSGGVSASGSGLRWSRQSTGGDGGSALTSGDRRAGCVSKDIEVT